MLLENSGVQTFEIILKIFRLEIKLIENTEKTIFMLFFQFLDRFLVLYLLPNFSLGVCIMGDM